MPLSFLASTAVAIRARLRARRPTRESIVIAGALALVFGACYLAAFFIRSELLLRGADANTIVQTIGWVVACKLAIFYVRGICHKPVRAIRFEDLSSLVRATTTALLVFVAVNFYFPKVFPDWVQIPRTVILLDWAFTLLAVGGMQATARSVYEELMPVNPRGQRRAALFIDASPEGVAIAEGLGTRSGGEYAVSGLLDDDPAAYGTRLAGSRVIGAIDDAAPCAQRLRVGEVIVRRGCLFGARLRRLCDECEARRIQVGIAERGGGSAEAGAFLVRRVEIRDLIPRVEERFVAHDPAVARWLAGRTVLVTGAAGTVGAEVCRQILSFGPAKLVLLDRSERALVALGAELQASAGGSFPVETVLADVGHGSRVAEILARESPDVVIHTAALNHLATLEANPEEAIETNLFATVTLADLCQKHGVETFVATSTDKAVKPASVLGATKLLVERFLQALAGEATTRFVVVRIGNVLGSHGGAAALFSRLMHARRPITITHPGMARHFVTEQEAARAVLVAGAVGKPGDVVVPDMGPPMGILDLVEAIAFVERIPLADVRIEYGTPRPGEKLAEDLFFDDEARHPVDGCSLHRVARSSRSLTAVRGSLADLEAAIDRGDRGATLATLRSVIAEETGPDGGPLVAGSKGSA